MPTYDYQCSSCGYRFEKLQSIKDDPLSLCPECEGPVRRLIGAGVGIIFKGSGFYTTDYKKTSSSMSTPSNGSSKKEETKKESADPKKESKTESVTTS